MKHFLLIAFIASASSSAAFGQSAQWLKKPSYDRMAVAPGADLLLADSAQTTVLLDFEGHRLASTSDSICGFSGNLALTVNPQTQVISGFFNTDGKFTSLEDKNFKVAMHDPYFHDGMLLVKASDGYGFVNSAGEIPLSSFPLLYPYHGGAAPAMVYEDAKKQKNPYYMLFDNKGDQIKFVIPGKGPVDSKNVDFISAATDDGRCIVVIRHKLYMYSIESGQLEPMFTDSDLARKNQIEVHGEMMKWLESTDDGFRLSAAAGKDNPVSFLFNRFFQPTKICYPNLTEDFRTSSTPVRTYPTRLSSVSEGKSEGLRYDDVVICPPQFDKVDFCIGDIAVVTSKGRQGIVSVVPDRKATITINKGDDVAFRHQKYNTTIRLELPAEVGAEKFNLDVDQSKGCRIDHMSRRFNNTENGNWVQYDCTLFIPDSLPATLTTITYPVTVVNDGLKLSDIPISVKAWHYRYHTVDIDESELVIDNGNVLFPVSIESEKAVGDSDYPVELSIRTNGLGVEIDKISETLYKCKILDLAEGPNSFSVVLREKGCPPIVHPFMVDYTKGKRTRGRTVKETAAIQRQSILNNASMTATDIPSQQSAYLDSQSGNGITNTEGAAKLTTTEPVVAPAPVTIVPSPASSDSTTVSGQTPAAVPATPKQAIPLGEETTTATAVPTTSASTSALDLLDTLNHRNSVPADSVAGGK